MKISKCAINYSSNAYLLRNHENNRKLKKDTWIKQLDRMKLFCNALLFRKLLVNDKLYFNHFEFAVNINGTSCVQLISIGLQLSPR